MYKDEIEFKTEQTKNTEHRKTKKKSFFKRIGRKCRLIQIYIKENNNQHR